MSDCSHYSGLFEPCHEKTSVRYDTFQHVQPQRIVRLESFVESKYSTIYKPAHPCREFF